MSQSGRKKRCIDQREGLYRIGEVSKATGLSQRALRHYADLKLMEPSFIDEGGYRYYSYRAMLKAPVIAYFKKMGLSLEEITSIFKCRDFTSIRRSFLTQREDCLREIRNANERLEIIEDWNEAVEEAAFVLGLPSVGVTTKYLPSASFLAMPYRFTGDYADATINLAFTSFVDATDNVISGTVIMRRSFEGEPPASWFREPCDAVVLQKALRAIDPACEYTRPQGLFLSLYHVGDYGHIGCSYQRIFEYAAQHGHVLCGVSYERFVTDYWTTYDPGLFVTELLLPIQTQGE